MTFDGKPTLVSKLGRLGATVAGTDPRSTGGHPKFQLKEKRRLQMNKFRFTINVLALAIFMFACASLAQAQATRTWVSGVGDDANPCSRTAPCKTFPGAISKTAVNGEINCLDAGGFGAVTITKSITIDCHEINAGVLNAGTTGAIINFDAFGGTDTLKTVRLRNINFNGAATGVRGVRIIGTVNASNSEVIIEDCLMNGNQASPGTGIEDTRGNAAGAFLSISNTTIRDMLGAGILINPAAGSSGVAVSIHNTQVHTTAGPALSVGSGVKAMVYNSVFSGSATGIFLSNTLGGGTEVALDHCVVSSNGTGLNASAANTTIWVSNSTLMFNGTLATTAGGGIINSYGGNNTAGAIFGAGVLQR
jgi:hypothetical protein